MRRCPRFAAGSSVSPNRISRRMGLATLGAVLVTVVVTGPAPTARAASLGPFLVLKHNLSTLGSPLYKPKDLVLPKTERFGRDGYVQRLGWTHWGTSRAIGQGEIIATSGTVVAHVTLVASDLVPLFLSDCGQPDRFRRYGSLRAHLRWSGDYVGDSQESRAVSGNLAGTPSQQC
jgi:hypothetical protein